MTAGLPGAGIGGLFYLLAALMTPFWEVARALGNRRSPRQWRLVMRHSLLAASILGAMWITGWLVGIIVTSAPVIGEHVRVPFDPAYPQVIGQRMALLTLTTLAGVLVGVELLRLWRIVLGRWCRPSPVQAGQNGRSSVSAPVAPADDAV